MRQLGKCKSYWVRDDAKLGLVIFLGMVLCCGSAETGPYLLKYISG